MKRIAIVGTVGLPPCYGGFETLAANLVAYAEREELSVQLDVYCSARAYPERLPAYRGARLHYLPLEANGMASTPYDIWAMAAAAARGAETILVLGVSGTLALPLLRLLTRSRLVVNVDGLEWRREKWSRSARLFLRLSEWFAARFAHEVVGDNQAIVEHLGRAYGRSSRLIPYGGDHAGIPVDRNRGAPPAHRDLPEGYALMLCRIEPENNIHMILEAFSRRGSMPLVAVGNWSASEYGKQLRGRFGAHSTLHLLDPEFDPDRLYALRAAARLYVHGHSAGGTNPALVEMMWLGVPVLAFDCDYNRHTTEERALYFASADDLARQVASLAVEECDRNASAMRDVAERRYRWDTIGRSYFALMGAHEPVRKG